MLVQSRTAIHNPAIGWTPAGLPAFTRWFPAVLGVRASCPKRNRRTPMSTTTLTATLGFAIVMAWISDDLQAQIERELFGIHLPAKALELLSEVEQTYGRPVREEWLPAEVAMSGNSKVTDDGTPVVQINPSHGKTTDVIVHELYHFKLRTRGFPVIQWLFPRQMETAENIGAFHQLREQMYDPILHHLFYSEVREAIGIDPGETFQRRTREGLSDHSYIAAVSRMDRGAAALYYFKLRIEIDDQALLNRIRELFQAEGKEEGIRLGERLAGVVKSARHSTPAEVIRVLIECLNIFYEGQLHFEERTWTSRQLGRHTQKIANIEVKPLQGIGVRK